MFCPQCGNEPTAGQHYCRSCGANLKVIGKAVSLGDAISRSDGVPAKIKEIVNSIKIAHVTDDVSRAMEKMSNEIVRSSVDRKNKWSLRKEKTAEQRRERHLVKGTIKLFWGGGLTIFLYFLAHALVLKLPPDVVVSIPFEIDPVVHVLWLLGLIPMLSGLGHIIAGLSIRPSGKSESELPEQAPIRIDPPNPESNEYAVGQEAQLTREAPLSVTDRTTNILGRDIPAESNR